MLFPQTSTRGRHITTRALAEAGLDVGAHAVYDLTRYLEHNANYDKAQNDIYTQKRL